MRGISNDETLQYKEAYECLTAIQENIFCTYRAYHGHFLEPLFKGLFHDFIKHVNYCGVGLNLQNEIDEQRIK